MPQTFDDDPRQRTSHSRWRGLGLPDGMTMYEVECLLDAPGWIGPVPDLGYRVYLQRSGAFLRRVNGRVTFVDPTSVLLTRPGDEMSVAHPLGCGDVYTCLEIPAEVLGERPDARMWFDRLGWDGLLDGRLDLEHRQLVARARRGVDRFELTERVHRFLAGVLTASPLRTGDPGADLDRAVAQRPATLAAHRRLADQARQVLAASGFALGLTDVARQVGCSPHHLSRVFQRVTGRSLTSYRNDLRVRAVLHTLASGDAPPLREMAAEYGFADQAHLTRTVRAQVGEPPARLRRLLAPDPARTTSGMPSRGSPPAG
ncbi:helix-turn-helix domain-containing protein [Micromonospora sagamiensis]|uniref:AraC-like DNA-binding protein n=1 Tax=Micromonospora sagamiensis TaxID=47875 RepID=A0A562WM50_9ACTN|nr:AraC family transcriptional regulator [Micromonospora sagamiensis]TWJ31268.1 AraC-like DNA-binding protein [Micromonospora sagamiensis]BCL15687.1 AraC family transcriptional regulator [Micromonospora sagamiensis]